jgi:putative flippase GtrA
MKIHREERSERLLKEASEVRVSVRPCFFMDKSGIKWNNYCKNSVVLKMNLKDDSLTIVVSKTVTQHSVPAQKTRYAVLIKFFYFTGVGAVGTFIQYTFRSAKNHPEALSKFMAVSLSGLLLNTLVMAGAMDLFSLHYLLAQVLATVVVLIWNFSVNLLWTFR